MAPKFVPALISTLKIAMLLVWMPSSLQAQSKVQQDWPWWRGPQGNGVWEAPAKLSWDWSRQPPVKLWQRPLGPAFSGIAVVGQQVFTMDRQPNEATKMDPLAGQERVICLDRTTGKEIWSFSYDAHYKDLDYHKGPRCTPTVHQGRVFTLGAVGHLHCLQAETGKVLWKKDLAGEHHANIPMWGCSAAPLVINNSTLIVHAGLEPNGCYVALSLETGDEKWRSGSDPVGYSPPILIENEGRQILVGWNPENIVGMESTTGRMLWNVPYPVTYGVSIATPIYQEGHILVSGYWEGTKLIALNPQLDKATLVWEENQFLRGLMSQPLYRNNHVYLLDKTHGITCFNLITGKVRWSDQNKLTPRNRNPQVSMVWLNQSDRAICLNAEGELVVTRFTTEGYSELARHRIVAPTWAHPAYSGEHVFARDDEKIVCFGLPTKVSSKK